MRAAMNTHSTIGRASEGHVTTRHTNEQTTRRELGPRWVTAARRATGVFMAASMAGAIGCAGASNEPATTTTSTEADHATAVTLSADAQRIYERTLVRDGSPACAELTAGIEAPVPALVEITARVTAPASSGMRAAECLLESHALEVEPTLTSWVSHESTLGFGLLVLGHLDELDPTLGERLARAALAGEIADRARSRIARSERHHALAEGEAPGATR